MSDKKVILQFTVLTFCIAYGVTSALIILGQFGYKVYGLVNSLQQFAMNIPFAIYILSPAIASFINLIIVAGLMLYFGIHTTVSGRMGLVFLFYMFFLSLPGNFIIGGLEEAGWMNVLQPRLDKKYGSAFSSAIIGVIWAFWHIPLFFNPGTNHCDGGLIFGCSMFKSYR